MYTLRLKKANNYKITLRNMTYEDVVKFQEIKNKRIKDIYKLAIFVMFGLMGLVTLMIHLYNLSLH
ncbi:hypothetical protein H8S10_08835 [Clostridium sp. NSJ-49]|uniref:Uncharacterized protein n=1 Tax=Clostridium disporicum TaxID=84024 RepID=A0A173ZIV6_9CLOT|nr:MULTISPECIES: hypothetical protein [Clostridium]MBC5625556.1 hypothetical protein [Clostridium sp. NSJ-49]MCD2502861.1 hypothetical protein [Clostridium sp. NSJ-145]CUN76161.1 Uncharacterised protein [Clostridium disporicum]